VAPELVADVLVGTMLFRSGLLREGGDASFARQLAEFVVQGLTPPVPSTGLTAPASGDQR
jgi:hypothetical protein